ncbi:MAG: hypothetical protein HYU69_14060 [Bacteroidetes bacterium]|nr:hypothetical protein [Bacteroidota bacterium]
MKVSHNLFDLIKSLNKTEKRYFKRYSSLHVIGEANNYLLLFDAIDTQKEYDEEQLIRQFKAHNNKNRFSVLKNYLYDQILYSMEQYHHSVHSEVRGLIARIEFLYEKGLDDQALKTLQKAKQLAKENEMHWSMIEILSVWEMNLAYKRNDISGLNECKRQKANELELLMSTETYRDIKTDMYTLYTTHSRIREKGASVEMKKIISDAKMNNEAAPLTFMGKIFFYETFALYWEGQGNSDQYYKYSKKIVDLYHENPKNITSRFKSYLDRLSNLIASEINSKRFKETAETLNIMKEASPLAKTALHKERLFFFYNYLSLDYFINTAQFSKAMDLIDSFEKELKIYEPYLNEVEKVLLFSNISISFFGVEQYQKSIFWINRARNETSLSVHSEFYNIISIYYLIIHYEAGNTDLLPYLIQSLYRNLKKKEKLYKFETIILDFLRNKIPKTSTQQELIVAFRQLKNKITPLSKDQYEKNALSYFDIISWLESKIENRSFAEVVKERSEHN